MPLVFNVSVSPQIAALSPQVSAMFAVMVERNARFSDLKGKPLSISSPHKIYAAMVAPRGGPITKQFMGYQSLVLSENTPVGLAAYAPASDHSESDADIHISRISIGTEAADIYKAFDHALSLEAAEHLTLETRLLYVNELHMSFVWLHGDDDIFIPIVAAHGFENKPYKEDVLDSSITEEIAKLLITDQLLDHIKSKRSSYKPSASDPETGGQKDE